MADLFRMIFPAEGLKVRMPEHGGRHIPDDGMRVQWPGPANFWARAELRGDIRSEEIAPEEVQEPVAGPSGSSSAGDPGEGPHPSPVAVRESENLRPQLPESEETSAPKFPRRGR